ncbi:hypothetical protein CAEBREN_02610 [Caenorhabditis brenneri]|uniref:Uncharacterized protein n=1 Tax=Caenorhabditis brenneri TaxID=135651 RepID=G0MY76_CAEBE|nr:hypothetical protein CAEBREN_02610 [Caenorhabditis brenneri]
MCQSSEKNNAPSITPDMENIARIANEEALEPDNMVFANNDAIIQQIIRDRWARQEQLIRQNEEIARRLFGLIIEHVIQNVNNLPREVREGNAEQVARPVEQNNDNADQQEGGEENNKPDNN